jgi:hypothetical protein
MNLMKDPLYQKGLQEKNLERTGWSTPFENPEILDKARQTHLRNHGKENPFSTEEVKNMIKQTNIERYGYENVSHNSQVKLKKEKTLLKNYGVRNPQQSSTIRKKTQETCLLKYGTIYPLQNSEIARKTFQHGVQKRNYILPSGKMVKLAGYEAFVLDELLQTGLQERDFDFQFEKLTPVWYLDPSGKKRRYYPDFFVPRLNWIIEVKSIYTYEKERATNLAKFRECRAQGFAFNLLIRYPRQKLVLLQVSRPQNDTR